MSKSILVGAAATIQHAFEHIPHALGDTGCTFAHHCNAIKASATGSTPIAFTLNARFDFRRIDKVGNWLI